MNRQSSIFHPQFSIRHRIGNPLPFVLAACLLSCGTGRDEDRFAGIRADILDFIEDENVPSVSVAVAQHGRIIWEESFGWADRGKQIRATPQTMYELASIAKVFTTTGIMLLRERGLLDIDAPVEGVLGDVSIKTLGTEASGVTLRRILQHTSGLPMFWGEPARDSGSGPTQKDILDRYAILGLRPGQQELYSNIGIALAIHAVEVTARKPYADFMQDSVLSPLGLMHTRVVSAPVTTGEFAQQYDHEGKPWTYTAGFYASAHDLLRFGMFHLKNHLPDQRAILRDSTLDLMQTSIDSLSDFRLPWWVWEYEGFVALVFTGASGTIMALVPEADLAIVVLANRLQANTPRICRWIAEAVLDDFDDGRRLPTGVRTHQKTEPPSLSRGSLLGTWRGSIVTPERTLPVELRVDRIGFPEMRRLEENGVWSSWVESMPSLRGSYTRGVFSAYFPLRIPIRDTREHDHWTWLYVRPEGQTLQGYAVAHAGGGPHFGLPYFIALTR